MNVHQNEMLFRKAIKGEKDPGSVNAYRLWNSLLRVTGSTNGSKLLAKIIINKQIILKRQKETMWGKLAVHRGQPQWRHLWATGNKQRGMGAPSLATRIPKPPGPPTSTGPHAHSPPTLWRSSKDFWQTILSSHFPRNCEDKNETN